MRCCRLTLFIDGVFDHKGYTEKSLQRLIKTRYKADRAAARQAAQAPLVAAMLMAAPAMPTPEPPIEESSPDAGTTEIPSVEGEEASNITAPTKDVPPDRTTLLRSKPDVVGRFMRLMVPILIDVYAASVITPVRTKTLTGLLKAVSFLDAEGLKRVLTVSHLYYHLLL